MREVWSDRRRFEHWLRIEILAAEAWAETGRVPRESLPAIRRATFDVEKIAEVEERVGHDVIAFLTVVGESIGSDSRFLHLGMTSSDVLDTALALQLRGGGPGHRRAEEGPRGRRRARHPASADPDAGRTHGIHAEPITFGFKVAGWVAELERALDRLAGRRPEISVGKLSGAVGSHATIPPEVEERVLASSAWPWTRPAPRSSAATATPQFLAALAIAAGTLERIALEIRHLQRTEVGEAFEPFGREQKGSSAMPHKRNPVLTERVCGLARVVRGYAATGLENIALWHERDISHSSAERVILPDACALVDYMAIQMHRVLAGLEVKPERMLHNLEAGGGVVYSQRVLLALVDAGHEPGGCLPDRAVGGHAGDGRRRRVSRQPRGGPRCPRKVGGHR